ncbi:hypothetical protein THRCLA_05800 [Thraustotheca clavata]|uniref:RBR-type E3 ubiquitin transferase n=1 Tax=Thraustotheca clavata TaxID=74557 RepID=A0A1V9ZSN0_9STRA|nr:hypothetical protein THRCLA_05800 [Thraustotheca clavata]
MNELCNICFEIIITPSIWRCDTCSAVSCLRCMRQYVRHKVNGGQVTQAQLVCPGVCRQPLTNLEALMAPTLWLKYTRFLTTQLEIQRGTRYCPRPSCGAALQESDEVKTKGKRRVYCHTCQIESCFNCGEPFHSWPLCKDRQFRRYCDRNEVQTCNKCKWPIEKHGGCNHMTCLRCAYEFCWLCQQDWNTHSKVQCLPLAVFHSKNIAFGPTPPVRFVTKSVVATVAAGSAIVVGTAAAGLALTGASVIACVAVFALPPIAVKQQLKKAKLKKMRPLDATAAA